MGGDKVLNAVGKGWTRESAARSAVGEARERASAFREPGSFRRASYRQLGDDAIHPDRYLLFSESQLSRKQDQGPAARVGIDVIPERLPPDAQIEWVRLQGVVEDRSPRYFPAGCLFFGWKHESARFCRADSVGMASWGNRDGALVAGLLECIERDAVALWWYNRLILPRIDAGSLSDPWLTRLKAELDDLDCLWWFLDLTTDLGLPVFASLGFPRDDAECPPLMGFSAGFDAAETLRKAAIEMTQGLPLVSRTTPHLGQTSAEMLQFTRTDLPFMPFLRGCPTVQQVRRRMPRDRSAEALADQLESTGYPSYYLDLTPPGADYSVVKVAVPGLRPPWPRYAPGRLFDVPVSLGRLATPCSEFDLNPVPFVL